MKLNFSGQDIQYDRFKQEADSTAPTYFKFEIKGTLCTLTIVDPGKGVFDEKRMVLKPVGPDSSTKLDMSLHIH